LDLNKQYTERKKKLEEYLGMAKVKNEISNFIKSRELRHLSENCVLEK